MTALSTVGTFGPFSPRMTETPPMAIMERFFEVDRPAEDVWCFLTDPRSVAECLPGARLLQVVDDRTFRGEVTVRVGPFGTTLTGEAHFGLLDETARHVELTAEARDDRGGWAQLSMSSRLASPAANRTRVEMRQTYRLYGRLSRFIASALLHRAADFVFRRFAACVRARLEEEEEGRSATPRGGSP